MGRTPYDDDDEVESEDLGFDIDLPVFSEEEADSVCEDYADEFGLIDREDLEDDAGQEDENE